MGCSSGVDFVRPPPGSPCQCTDSSSVAWETFDCNTQPLGDEALQRLPEAERFKPSYQFFTNVKSVKVGDYLRMGGKKYRAVTDQDFDKYGYADNIFILYDGVEDMNNGGFELPYGN